jgi:cytochrome o ubiquinol oxidase subunit 2
MSGMTTQLHIRGDTVGDYRGSSANISGEGFAGMHFAANVVSNSDYKNWTLSAQNSQDILTREVYADLAKPSKNNPEKTYVAADPDLFMSIIDKYMSPQGTPPTQETQYTESTDMEMMEHMHAH